MNTTIHSFPPLSTPHCHTLILGSMPGIQSLAANQYYAHRQNQFWRIMGAALDFDPASSYETRTAALLENNIALWDVLKSCEREGSLDSAIKNEIPNDLPAFLKTHPEITRILFNGQKAEAAFRRHLENPPALITLPSTSPAHQTLPPAAKARLWDAALPGPPLTPPENPGPRS
jgi:double-stranded uracil-DNA glycosylase